MYEITAFRFNENVKLSKIVKAYKFLTIEKACIEFGSQTTNLFGMFDGNWVIVYHNSFNFNNITRNQENRHKHSLNCRNLNHITVFSKSTFLQDCHEYDI